MKIEKLTRWHWGTMEMQGIHGVSECWPFVDKLIEQPSWAGVAYEGIICAMGFNLMNDKNWRCWACTDDKLLPLYLVAVCKHVRRQISAMLAEGIASRIETVVQSGNPRGSRWVELLGFEEPHLMRNFNQYGDALLYERVI